MIKIKTYLLAILSVLVYHAAQAQDQSGAKTLSDKQKGIVLMAALTAKGDLQKLKPAINKALDAGLTVNECKEVFLHSYAYCGFPRSIQGLNTLIATLDERKEKGIKDNIGREATPIDDTNKYETGWKN